MGKNVIGIIGGSGVCDISGSTNKRWQRIDSLFSETPDKLLHGEIGGQQLVFLPRYGRSPTRL